jgi:lysophospholipase L1-like esterase
MRSAAFCLAFALFIALTASACGGDGKSLTPTGYEKAQGGLYLALGDSIAAGAGASDSKSTSYVGRVESVLRQHYNNVELRNLAVGGHTTQDLIDQQLPAALDALKNDDVRLVTITIGGNDLNVVQNSPDAATCIADVNDPKCPVAEILVGTEERLDRVMGDLRGAGADVPIAIQVYPNLFSGTGHVFEQPAGQAFGKLNDVIERVAAKHDILIADPRAAFEGRGGKLTHTLDATPDFHPNDAGYGAIADAFLNALGLSTTD